MNTDNTLLLSIETERRVTLRYLGGNLDTEKSALS